MILKITYSLSEVIDLDKLIETGVYFVKNHVNAPAELPSNSHACFFVFGTPDVGTAAQYVFPDNRLYISRRHMNNSTGEWTKWTKTEFT